MVIDIHNVSFKSSLVLVLVEVIVTTKYHAPSLNVNTAASDIHPFAEYL